MELIARTAVLCKNSDKLTIFFIYVYIMRPECPVIRAIYSVKKKNSLNA